ncbi:MAG: insulinase family protein, partial [Verrucomicrobiota bacterium]
MDESLLSTDSHFVSKPHVLELSNGLHLIVQTDDSAPVVSLQYWVGTGSIHEGEWLGTGISHFLEHLMFKGTEKRGNSQMAQEIQALGGHLNAYTTFDHTVYYVDLPSDHWKPAGEILGDAVFNSTLPAEEFDGEQEVIRREFAMGEDNPDRRLSRLLFKTAFQKHPYRFPVIGLLPLFNKLRREDLVRYYKQRYVPQNVTLIVVGNVEFAEVKQWAHEFLEKIPASILQEVVISEEPVQMLPREFRETFPTDLLRLSILFHIPGIEHPDTPALDLLSVMMGGTRGSRLHQLIVEQKGLAEEVSAYAYTPSGHGLWGVSTRGQVEKSAELEKMIRDEIYHINASTFSENDLARSKRQLLLHHYRGLKSMSGKAGEIGGGWLLTKDPLFQGLYLDRLRSVTLEEVVAVAKRYLRPSVENLISIVPEQLSETKPVLAKEIPFSKAAVKDRLSNGLSLIRVRNPHLPLMTYRMIFPGGLLADPQGKSGLSLLSTQLLMKGTRCRSASELIQKIESLGGVLGSDSNVNTATLSLEILSSDWEEGLDLFQEIINEPMLRPEELETERRKQISSIQMDLDQPMSLARNMVREVLFSDHPYRNNAAGRIEELKEIQGSDIETFWAQNLRATETIFSLSTSID